MNKSLSLFFPCLRKIVWNNPNFSTNIIHSRFHFKKLKKSRMHCVLPLFPVLPCANIAVNQFSRLRLSQFRGFPRLFYLFRCR